jgi:hypothetical protein
VKHLRPPSPATLIALIALFVALGGTGYAASHHSTAAKKKKKHALTERRVNSLIASYFNKNRQQLIGPRGLPGVTGPSGANATKLFVQVRATPTPSIVRGSGVTAVAGPADTGTTGLYQVTFNRDLSGCVAVASRTSPDGNFPGVGGAAVNHADATSINVQTFDGAGALSSAIDFALAVFC